ncbi:MAG: protein phosphatase 2C domain-containing protein [Paludibacteraceae bacterium]|nr:protein phosphatase 2C domain-containing protein [Paludibacteraceae bacterium]
MAITLRYAARCEAAGRDHNEDNFLLDYNLNDDQWGFNTDEVIPLEGNGSILLVCDGMGGMNAGEVASAVAVQTIKEWFDHTRITAQVTASSQTIQDYIYKAIQAADEAIKADEKEHPEHDGMGSTIVLAWIINDKVYVGWCGDSRAYRYNPITGLQRLSHDHSYVQELVDAGKLTEELAFDHPNNNIITRSLGDPRGKAKPDVKEFELYHNDIIMLCSDGLCGCLRDNEIEAIIEQHQTSMKECRDALWDADEAAGWHDNVTITLAQVVEGGKDASLPISNSKAELIRKNNTLKRIIAVISCVLVACAALLCWWFFAAKQPQSEVEKVVNDEIVTDSITQPQEISDEVPQKEETAKTKPSKKNNVKKSELPKEEKVEEPSLTPTQAEAAPQLTPIAATPTLTPIKQESESKNDTLHNDD